MPRPNDPALVAKALAKAQSVENRLNDVINGLGPEAPSILYGTATTVVTQSAGGSYTWTCPAGVTSALIECWGAGAGANGGSSSSGAEAGGGGAYSAEPAYQLVPGTVYTYIVGDGGDGATTGNGGTDGGDTYFDLNGASGGVFANGGSAGGGGFGGAGGAATSGQSVSFAGGNGGGGPSRSTGGCGGGSSGSPAGAGSNGATSSSSTGASGGAGGTDKGAGGNGGNAGANGSPGGSPGGAGGGCGAASASSQVSFSYHPTASCTYYGHDATGGNANQKRTSVGATMYQGGTTSSGGTYNGTMKSVMLWPSSIPSDLSGVTIDSCSFSTYNLHSWYNSGMTIVLGYGSYTSLGSSYSGGGLTNVKSYATLENSIHTTVLTTTGVPAALKSGACRAFVLGLAPDYNLNYYGYFAGAGQSNAPTLNITGHTGAAPVTAGDGADGQVRITYATNSNLIAAVQPAATTDAAGNAVAAGFTGQLTAVQPGSSPANVETWHSMTLINSWGSVGGNVSNKYRFLGSPPNSVEIIGSLNGSSATNAIFFQLPSGYQPASQQFFPLQTTSALQGNWFGQCDSSGNLSVQVHGTGTIAVVVVYHGIISLDA